MTAKQLIARCIVATGLLVIFASIGMVIWAEPRMLFLYCGVVAVIWAIYNA